MGVGVGLYSVLFLFLFFEWVQLRAVLPGNDYTVFPFVFVSISHFPSKI